jgi:hypothetical protein
MGIGDWGLGPIPNPQSPIPNLIFIYFNFLYLNQKLRIILINNFFIFNPKLK